MLDFQMTDEICKNIADGKREMALERFYSSSYEPVSSYYYRAMRDTFSKERDIGIFIASWDVHNIANLNKIVDAVISSGMNNVEKRKFLSPVLYSDKIIAFDEGLFPVLENVFDGGEMTRFKRRLALRNDTMDAIVFRLESCEENGYAVYYVDNSKFLNKTYSKKY